MEPEVKFVANVHGNEVLGRQMLIYLAQFLCSEYLQGDERVQTLINTTRIHILASMNPDGYEVAVSRAPDSNDSGGEDDGREVGGKQRLISGAGAEVAASCLVTPTGSKVRGFGGRQKQRPEHRPEPELPRPDLHRLQPEEAERLPHRPRPHPRLLLVW